jgi:hypothetical protein
MLAERWYDAACSRASVSNYGSRGISPMCLSRGVRSNNLRVRWGVEAAVWSVRSLAAPPVPLGDPGDGSASGRPSWKLWGTGFYGPENLVGEDPGTVDTIDGRPTRSPDSPPEGVLASQVMPIRRREAAIQASDFLLWRPRQSLGGGFWRLGGRPHRVGTAKQFSQFPTSQINPQYIHPVSNASRGLKAVPPSFFFYVWRLEVWTGLPLLLCAGSS